MRIEHTIFAFIILFLIVLLLIFIEKKLTKKLKIQKKSRNLFYKRKIKKLSKLKSNPEEFLDAINNLARDFFKEAFDLSYSLEYSELINEFRTTEKKECITFCTLISEINYSGKKIEEHKLSILIKLLEKIIGKNKIFSEEERKEMKQHEKGKKQRKKLIEKGEEIEETKSILIENSPKKKTIRKVKRKKLKKSPKKNSKLVKKKEVAKKKVIKKKKSRK